MSKKLLLSLFLITLAISATTIASTDGLVGWWKMNSPDPVDPRLVKDSSGFGNDGTMGSKDAWLASGGIDFNGGNWGDSGIVFANSGADLIADMGLSTQVTISYVATWEGFTGTLYPYDGRDSNDLRILSSECPTGSGHIRDHKGGTDLWCWEAFNDEDDRFIFSNNGLDKTWGDFIRVTTIANFDTGDYKIYVDDKLYASDVDKVGSFADLTAFTIGRTLWSEMDGKMKDFRIYNREITEQEVMDFFIPATSPSPADGASVINLLPLSWKAGNYAASHDVYLGTTFADVNDATTSSDEFMGNQIANTYDAGILAEGTYFWRVDEVNDIDVWKGEVWSFSLYPMPEPVLWLKLDEPDPNDARLVKDYSVNGNDGTMGSEDVWIDVPGLGGGIDFDGGSWGASGIVFVDDSNDIVADMNLTSEVTVSFIATWDNGEYTRTNYPYDGRNAMGDADGRILAMECTGSNHIRNFFGSLDNSRYTWDAFNDTEEGFIFGQVGSDWGDYIRITTTANLDTGDYNLYVNNKLCTAGTGYSGSFTDLASFSVGRTLWSSMEGKMTDFRIYDEALGSAHIAELVGNYPQLAKSPVPADKSTGNALDATLSWGPGEDANSHQVYFGTNAAAVANAGTASSVYAGEFDVNSYDPGALELFKTYYWRVDELDDAGELTMKGTLWRFDTIECVVVEDFESYDSDGNMITDVWTDSIGWGDIQISLLNDPCLSPINSMRLRYHVPYDPYYAMAVRSFSPAQDWTVDDVKILTVHYHGDSANFGLPVFVTVGDGTTDANVVADVNTLAENWQEINVSLPEIAAAGVDITNVTYMEIGFGDGTNKGMSSSKWDIIYVDDIALYPGKCILSESSLQADITEDCVVDVSDLAYIVDGWLSDLAEGDINGDAIVDFKDYSILADEWLVEDLWP